MEYLDTDLGCVLLVKSCLCEERTETLEKVQPQTCPNAETQSGYNMLPSPHTQMSIEYNSGALWLQKLQDRVSQKNRKKARPAANREQKNKVSRIAKPLVPVAITKHQTQSTPGRIKINPHTEGPFILSIYLRYKMSTFQPKIIKDARGKNGTV